MKHGTFFRRWIFAAVAICCINGHSARAGLGGVEESLEVQLTYAEAGDPSAQYNLALAHFNGHGVPRDLGKAVAWFRKAADLGLPEAQYNLAVCYLNGEGIEKNEKEAIKYLQAAAVQGIFSAQKTLIRCYATGIGVQKSPANALLWDFLARRTVELQTGLSVGQPGRPPKLRADGAAVWVNADGTSRAVHPDGSEETIARDGTRYIERIKGVKTEVTADGTEVSTYDNGVVERKLPDGTRVVRDSKGIVQTTYPDGRKLLEGKATTQDGREVQIAQLFGKDGKPISSRLSDGTRVQVNYPDGTFALEYPGEDEKGAKLTLIERHGADGHLQARDLVREDGRKREGEEEWTIKRWLRSDGGLEVQVVERYGLGGSVLKQEILKETTRPISQPAAKASAASAGGMGITPAPMKPAESTIVSMPARTATSMGSAGQARSGIEKLLGELEEIARLTRGYVGATDADYERARATAASFTIALQSAPQKSAAASALIARSLKAAAAPPQQPPLIEISSDLSDKYPLGLNGREALKAREWKHAETPNFVVHYAEVADAQPVMCFIETAYFVVTQTLGIDDRSARKKSHVFIFPDGAEWNEWLRKKRLPPMVAGYAYKDELLIGAQGEKDDYAKLICHEAAHAIVARYYPGRRWPLWLGEGFAEYMAAKAMAVKRTHQVQRYLSDKADKSIDITSVVNRLTYGGVSAGSPTGLASLGNFYPNSEKLVRVFQEKLPATEFPRFVNLLVAGNSFEASLRAAYGKSCPDVTSLKRLVDTMK